MKRTLLSVLLSLVALPMSAQGKLPFYDRGYAGNVELGFLVKSYPYGTLSTTHGYCFGKGWFIGLGGMFESGFYGRKMETESTTSEAWNGEGFRRTKYPYEGDMMIKIYLDLRKTFYLKGLGLFVDVKYGSPYNLAHPFGYGDFVRPTVGIAFRKHLGISAGLDWSSYPYPDAGTDVVGPKQITLPFIGFAYQF